MRRVRNQALLAGIVRSRVARAVAARPAVGAGVNDDDPNRIRLALVGERVTVMDCLAKMGALHGLLDAIGDAVIPPDEPKPEWLLQGVVMYDGAERPESREFVATCSDACRERVPAFLGCPYPLTFH